MTQNTSPAVMAQRREPHDSLDDFPTPPWATRALCERIDCGGTVREPAANRGFMARPLAEYFDRVIASDIHDYGAGYPVEDFLLDYWEPDRADRYEWVITNPPFRLAERFIDTAIAVADRGVAMLVRTSFIEGAGRYNTLFSRQPPNRVLQFVERVPMHRGKIGPDLSTATAYCWLVWEFPGGPRGTRLEWIPPCRKRLERPGDYDWAPL